MNLPYTNFSIGHWVSSCLIPVPNLVQAKDSVQDRKLSTFQEENLGILSKLSHTGFKRQQRSSIVKTDAIFSA